MMELKYWGIDERLFQKQKSDNFDIIESLLGEPILDFFDQREGSEFFFNNLCQSNLDFGQLYKDKKLKFKDEFRIRSIQQIVQVEFGADYGNIADIARICAINYDENKQILFDGELIKQESGSYCLDGYGRYISEKLFSQGHYKNHKLHGQGKLILSDGTIEEGHYLNDELNGLGKKILPDGTVEQGHFLEDELNGQGTRSLPNGNIE